MFSTNENPKNASVSLKLSPRSSCKNNAIQVEAPSKSVNSASAQDQPEAMSTNDCKFLVNGSSIELDNYFEKCITDVLKNMNTIGK